GGDAALAGGCCRVLTAVFERCASHELLERARTIHAGIARAVGSRMADALVVSLEQLALDLVHGGKASLKARLQAEFRRYDKEAKATPSGSETEGPTCYEVFHPTNPD